MNWKEEKCVVDGCPNRKFTKISGLCNAHKLRLERYGRLHSVRRAKGELAKWIFDHKEWQGEDCLIWPFHRDKDGRASGFPNVPRFMCEVVHGPAPGPKMQARHLCGKGHEGCVNPRHIEWSTVSVNQMDRVEHGTSNRGESNGQARLSEIDVIDICIQLNLGNDIKKISNEFEVSQATIYDIKAKRRWAWLTEGILK